MRSTLWLGALALAPLVALADPGAQNPAPINTFELDGGRIFNRRADVADESWYRLSVRGALVREAGTPFKASSGLDLASPPLPAPAEGGGDRNRWSLRYENGTASSGGGFFEALGVQPLTLRGLETLDLRGTAGIAGDNATKNLAIAVGLETAPWRIPGFANTGASNWIVAGLNGQRRKDAASGTTESDAALTYRAFVGKAFGWRKSGAVDVAAAKLERDVLAAAPTLAAAKEAGRIPVAQRTPIQKVLADLAPEARDEAEWLRKVKEYVAGRADAILDQPTFALYAESSGGWRLSNNAPGQRFTQLFSLTADYWFMPGRDDTFLRLRYEYGHEWALPDDKRNRLLASVGLRF